MRLLHQGYPRLAGSPQHDHSCISQHVSFHLVLVVDVWRSLDLPVHRRALDVCLMSLNRIFPERRASSAVLPVLAHQKSLSVSTWEGRRELHASSGPSEEQRVQGIYILVCLMINY